MASVGELTARIALDGIKQVQSQLRGFNSAMSDVADKANQMGSKLREAGEGLNDLGENMAPLSAGLLAIGGASVIASDNINNAFNSVQAKLGLADSEMSSYKGTIEEVASTGVGSFEEVSDALVSVSQNMKGVSGAQLADVTTEAQGLANIMGSDVGEVTKVAGQLMSQFGVDGTQAMDMIAKGYQNGMDYSGDYMDTLNEYSVYFKNLGFDANDMFNTLISGAEAGAFNLDKVGDAVKEFGIRSKDGSDSTKEAFKALGLDAGKLTETFANGGEGAKKAYSQVVSALADVDDQAKRNQIGVALFGTQYEDMEKDVIASTGNVKDAMGDVSGTSDDMIEKNKTFAQEMQGYWNQIQVAIKPVGDILRKALADVMPSVINGIKTVSAAFTSLSPTLQTIVLGFGAFIAVLPAIIIFMGSFASSIGALTGGFSLIAGAIPKVATALSKLPVAFTAVKNAFNILKLAFATNPWGLLIVGLIAVVALIVTNWDTVKSVTLTVWGYIKEFLGTVWEGFKSIISGFVAWFSPAITAIANVWSAIWNRLKAIASAVWTAIKTVILVYIAIYGAIFMTLIGIFKKVWSAIKSVVVSVVNAIKPIIASIASHVSSIMARVKSVFSSIWNAIYGSVISPVINKVKSLIATVSSHSSSVMGKVKSVFSSVWHAISGVIGAVIGTIKAKIQTIITIASVVGGRVKAVLSGAFNAAKSVITGAISTIKDKISSIWSTASGIASKIKSAFSGLFKGISVPHFSLSNASLNPKDWIKNGLPKINVAWHAKGGILDSTTLIGAGEKGAESIVPLSSQRRMKPFAQAVAKFMPEGGAGGAVVNHFNISSLVIREDADVYKLAQQLKKLQDRTTRAKGGLVL
ncbi:phage tail tape measure protein [Rummeliibacillus stabekisii]|uniref:phage tail tape measure protein n=1 Tax=Rummeliibacillus stabekisii TaxID=241244 RepID=UPI0037133FA8